MTANDIVVIYSRSNQESSQIDMMCRKWLCLYHPELLIKTVSKKDNFMLNLVHLFENCITHELQYMLFWEITENSGL